jgi:hypothetical protein
MAQRIVVSPLSLKMTYDITNNFKKDFLQATTIKIEDWSGSLFISYIYCPLKHIIASEQSEAFFEILDTRFIAVGNNAKHQCCVSKQILKAEHFTKPLLTSDWTLYYKD